MKRGLIILLFLGLSWGSVFAGQELFNGNICEQFLYRGEEIIKSICYSNEDEKSKQELDWKFNNFLTDKNYYYLSQDSSILISEGLKALEELERYKNTYDNYNYYKGQLSLFIGAKYYKGDLVYSENKYVPNYEEAEKYFKVYEENKNYKLKRVPYNFLMTYLNTSQEDMIEKKVDEVYEIFKNNISSLSTNLQNGKKTELIAKINSVYNEEDSDFVKYTLLYLKYIIQEENYRELVKLYNVGEYEKVIYFFNNFKDYYDYGKTTEKSLKYNELFYKASHIYLEAYINMLKHNNNTNFFKQAKIDYENLNSSWQKISTGWIGASRGIGYYSDFFTSDTNILYNSDFESDFTWGGPLLGR